MPEVSGQIRHWWGLLISQGPLGDLSLSDWQLLIHPIHPELSSVFTYEVGFWRKRRPVCALMGWLKESIGRQPWEKANKIAAMQLATFPSKNRLSRQHSQQNETFCRIANMRLRQYSSFGVGS